MKRLGLILAIALGLASNDAWAQWYLFPGFKKKAVDTTKVTTVEIEPQINLVEAESAPSENEFEIIIPQTINFSLVLPMENKGKLNSNMMDFYCGALLAVRKAGQNGTGVDFNIFDCSKNYPNISSSQISMSNIILGPVSRGMILKELEKISPGRFIISPLDPQAASLSNEFPVIHAASGTQDQMDVLLRWLKSDIQAQDKLIVVEESNTPRSETYTYMFDKLDEMGIKYQTIEYGILQGLKIFEEFERKCSTEGTTRFLIASDKDSFVGDAVRNVALMLREHQVVLYATSKLRSFLSIEADDLNRLSTRLTASYFTDYQDKAVKDFVLEYREFFHSEPGSFAFSGYDTANFFLSICAKYGVNWAEKVCEFEQTGLQEDFSFTKEEGMVGAVNKAVRKVLFNQDYSVSIVR